MIRALACTHVAFGVTPMSLSLEAGVRCEDCTMADAAADVTIDGRLLAGVHTEGTLVRATVLGAEECDDGSASLGRVRATLRWVVGLDVPAHRIGRANGVASRVVADERRGDRAYVWLE